MNHMTAFETGRRRGIQTLEDSSLMDKNGSQMSSAPTRSAILEGDAFRLERDGQVAVVTLDRPPVNALSQAAYAELAQLFEGFGPDDRFDVVLIRSASPRAFCAGADLSESRSATATDNAERQFASRRLFTNVRKCKIPVIVAVNGPALGAGLVLAACGDIRLAGPHATFGLPEINVGKGGGGRHMMRIIPQGLVRLMYFTGRPINATQARGAGLVDMLISGDDQDLDRAALELAHEIAGKSPLALRLTKEGLNLSESLPTEDGYAVEQQFSMRLAETHDGKEAAAAYLEKRPPVWERR
jgi:enoyl-CoA hydratase